METPQASGEMIKIPNNLLELQKNLVSGAISAYNTHDFQERSSAMATAVSQEAANLAAIAIGEPLRADELFKVFLEATKKAAGLFEPCFTPEGIPIKEKGADYTNATKAAGSVALEYLPTALGALDILLTNDEIIRIVKSATFDNMVEIATETLKRWGVLSEELIKALNERLRNLSPEEIKIRLGKIIPKDDYFYQQISDIPFREETDIERRPIEKIIILDMGIRLANATWQVGQVHRAAWEGSTERIDPTKRGGVFNPYDLLQITKFKKSLEEGCSPEDAILRVAFELWKDMRELQNAAFIEESNSNN
jgi:hypothetical protein